MARDNTIYLVNWGSRAYGTDTPASDIDVRGVFMLDKPYMYGFKDFESYSQNEGGRDLCLHSFQKYMKLLLNSSPNAVEWLFVEDRFVIHHDILGEQLRSFRDNFLSKDLVYRYAAYSAQVHRDFMKAEHPDGKLAYQLLRLVNINLELAKTGTLNVMRPDGDRLRKIKCGDYDMASVAEEYSEISAQRVEALESSPLEDNIDRDKIMKFGIDICDQFINLVEMVELFNDESKCDPYDTGPISYGSELGEYPDIPTPANLSLVNPDEDIEELEATR
jgi:predicted nucleotidyltransferase